MTSQQIAQVQASFRKITPIADQAAALFYQRLFETTPEVRALFNGDMTAQGQKQMTALATVVNGLGNIDAVARALRDLARRHVTYGVRPEHTRSSAPPCCGPWSKGSAVTSRPRLVRRGPRPTTAWRK
jgi:hemoglobin-like flavoprotein